MIDVDAALLALEISGELLPSQSLYEQIYGDLTAIRTAFPAMALIHHQPLWIPGELTGKLTAEAMAQFKAGRYHGLDSLSAQYGPIKIIPSDDASLAGLHFVTFKFSQGYNPECLTRPVSAAEGVWYAHAKWIGGDGNRIEVSESQYTFNLGWGNCKEICRYYHYWTFSVNDGVANLINKHGAPLIGDLEVVNDGPTTVGNETRLKIECDACSHPDITYAWDFGDGTPVVNRRPETTHIYPAIGKYTVVVTAHSFGHTATATTTITVTA